MTQERDLPELEGRFLGELGKGFLQRGRMESARNHLEKSILLLNEPESTRDKILFINTLSSLHREQGELQESRERALEGLKLAREHGMQWLQALMLNALGLLDMDEFCYQEARQNFRGALALLTEQDNPMLESNYGGNLGMVTAELGYLQEAAEHYKAAIHSSQKIEHLSGVVIWQLYLSTVLRLMGKLQPARELLSQSRDYLRDNIPFYYACHLCEQGHFRLIAGQSAEAELQEARRLLRERGADSEKIEEGRRLFRLLRAQQAWESKSGKAFYQGQLVEDLSPGQREWLQDQGLL